MIKAGFHLLDDIKHFFSQDVLQNARIIVAIQELYGAWWRNVKFKEEKHTDSLSCRSGNDICQQPESICDNGHQAFLLGSFLKSCI